MEIADKDSKSPGMMRLLGMPKITEERSELAAALALAQAEIDAVSKTETNPFFKSKYADLASVREAIREAFGKHGLSVVQIPHTGESAVHVTTILMHKSGQFIEGTLSLKPTKGDPQGIGSAITYARRYALMAFAGVAPDDDDGNAASQTRDEPDSKRRTETKPPPERNHWEDLKALLHKIGVEEGNAEEADAVVQYCTKNSSGGMVNLSMAHKQPGPCERAVKAVAEAWREFPNDCDTPLLQIVRESLANSTKGL